MKPLKQLIQDGFGLSRREGALEDLSPFSLTIGLKAYFSTARAMGGSLNIYYSNDSEALEHQDIHHPSSYIESYAETIVHFQHFAELVCKELLRKEHELLATDACDWSGISDALAKHKSLGTDARDPKTILHDLLNRSDVSLQKREKAKSVEFKKALERLCTLVEHGCMIDSLCRIVGKHRDLLTELNWLRNRIWHRGTFILRYPALDEFVGRFFLPFVFEVMSSPTYSNRSSVWKYEPLACGMDPIDEIIGHFRSNQYDVRKIAFLKELERAAYSNPFNRSLWYSYFDGEIQRRAVRFAGAETSDIPSVYSTSCPVCGTGSLMVYKEFMIVDEDSGADSDYVDEVKCLCCSFEPHPRFGTPADHGFPIQNWD